MKSLTAYLVESLAPEHEKFAEEVKKLDPTKEVDVKKYFALMYQAGICMHPDDSWEECTVEFPADKSMVLDKFIGKALEKFKDKVYDWGTEELKKFMEQK